jgi:ech hydrogenase subunit E
MALVPMVDDLEREMMRTVIPIFTTSSTARSRCAGIGVLTHEKAISCAVVGPTARASGINQDLRRDAPYAAYAEMKFEVPGRAGRRRARPPLRARSRNHGELPHSAPGAHRHAARRNLVGGEKLVFVTGTATSRVEAPRGEVMYSVSWKEGSRNPGRVHVRTPTFANMPAVRWMVRGARLADTPLIQASIDPCYSCTDR